MAASSLFSKVSLPSPLTRIKKRVLGFTLLELLVVVAILGILMAMGAVAFSTAQRQGRDAKRRADMKALQGAFEQYYADNNQTYGASCVAMAVDPYMPGEMPTDPSASQSYNCTVVPITFDGYCACAHLENEDSGNAADGGAAGACNFGGGTTDYFCVTNLQ